MTANSNPKPLPFISVTQGMSGFFAVMYWFNDQEPGMPGFWEPYDTGFGRYATYDEAAAEAKVWAESEDLQFKG